MPPSTFRAACLLWAAVAGATFAPSAGAAEAGSGPRSPDGVWSEAGSDAVQGTLKYEVEAAGGVRLFQLDDLALFGLLRDAPLEFTAAARPSPLVLTLPMPDGSYARFRVAESPILSAELAHADPGVKTYVAQGIDDPAHTARFDRTALGFHAIIVTPDDYIFVDRATSGPGDVYASFHRRDLPASDGVSCSVDETSGLQISNPRAAQVSGASLRTYDLAIATTGEFTNFYGSPVPAAAAVIQHVNQVNAIYEREVAIRFKLVCLSMYGDRLTDPFTNPESVDGLLLTQSDQALDTNCGANAYQVGHLFHLRAGSGNYASGNAQLGVVCGGSKGRAASTSTRPDLPTFVVDLVSHEMGHQFGATHTYNSTIGGCSQRFGSSAYEIGAGTTIMSYACAGCTGEDPPGCADAYFHGHSFDQITVFRDGIGSCGAPTVTGNSAPSVDAGPDRTIPRETPFTLTATGSDPDGDAVSWNWEEFDLGAASPPLNGSVSGPLFRSFPAGTSPSRTFPNVTNLLAGTAAPFEILPTVDRTLTFRATVRDNRAGGGGVKHDTVVLTVRGEPFRLISPNGGEVLDAGSIDVTWRVGGGHVAPSVNILYSTDGGRTFSVTLASNVPNDGAQRVTLPRSGTDELDARIRVEGAGSIFFDVSDTDFVVRPGDPQPLVANINGPLTVTVDGSGTGVIEVKGSVVGECAVAAGNVRIVAVEETGAMTLGSNIDAVQVGPHEVAFSGTVAVSQFGGCPGTFRVFVHAIDACGMLVEDYLEVAVLDDLAPLVMTQALGGVAGPTGMYLLPFSASITDNCPVDPGAIVVSATSAHATVGLPVVQTRLAPRGEVKITGSVLVSRLISCPAVIRLEVGSSDGCGNRGSIARKVEVLDLTLAGDCSPTGPAASLVGPSPPALTRLAGIGPNPFLRQTAVAFELARRARVTLAVYAPAGSRVRALADLAFDAGRHSVIWNGRDDAGRRVPPGMYFVRFAADGVVDSGKALLLP